MFSKRFAAALLALATTTAVGLSTVAAQSIPISGQYYQIQVVRSGLRLEVAFGSTDFAPIIQGPGAPNYLPSNWRFDSVGDGFYQIINRNGGNCLQGGEGEVRLVIDQNTCLTNNPNYHWRLNPVSDMFTITNRATGLSLCIIGDLTFAAVPLVSDTSGSTCDQRFRLIPVI